MKKQDSYIDNYEYPIGSLSLRKRYWVFCHIQTDKYSREKDSKLLFFIKNLYKLLKILRTHNSALNISIVTSYGETWSETVGRH